MQAASANGILLPIDLAALRAGPKDLVIHYGAKEIKVNRAVISAESAFFATHLTTQLGKVPREGSITLKEFHPDWTPRILELLQSGGSFLNYSFKELVEASHQADFLQLSGEAAKQLEQAFITHIQKETLSEIIKIARKLRYPLLERACLDFLSDEKKGILTQEGLEQDLVLLFETSKESFREKCLFLALEKAIIYLKKGESNRLEILKPILKNCVFLDQLEHSGLKELRHYHLEELIRCLSPQLWGIKLEKIQTGLFFLASCPNLTFLSITKSTVQCIEELQGLRKLRKIDFSGNIGKCETRPFIFLKELEEVNIRGFYELGPLSYLTACPALRKVIVDAEHPDLANLKENWKEKLTVRPLTHEEKN